MAGNLADLSKGIKDKVKIWKNSSSEEPIYVEYLCCFNTERVWGCNVKKYGTAGMWWELNWELRSSLKGTEKSASGLLVIISPPLLPFLSLPSCHWAFFSVSGCSSPPPATALTITIAKGGKYEYRTVGAPKPLTPRICVKNYCFY